ncbi:MAG: tRNA (N(6)-L-threonylcarbamoyladenosine(37)-C(2))-methylthiotransferase MtaB [Fusobacteriaceae bacterium]|nr:tRNA (N(6)-L-threonylcarbamoyladenosine(37)-C(2))-methylthiotransferase MtaB [Fusobacteriaceae bacterium]
MSLNKKVAFHTLGCKVNQYETESIKNQLSKLGYAEVPFEEIADIYIINSCTVTSIADKKTRNMLRRAKKNNKNSIVILTGCYAETNSKDLEEIDEIDYIVGNKDKQGIVNLIKDIENEKESSRVINESIFVQKEYEEYEIATLREMSRAYVKIQDGCNSFCSYCKIPFARGKSRSRKIENIIDEIEKIVEQGYKEIILIGINIGAYGEDLEEKLTLENLVKKIVEINGVERIRFGSIYPDRIRDEFIELFKNPKVLPHIHLSLQSGDDTILKAMKRKYDSELIKSRCTKIKKEIKNLEFTADVIVGFPGETDEMHKNTYETIKSIGFIDLHIFQYSDREGTLASTFSNKVDIKTKKFRADDLENLRVEMFNDIAKKYIGETLETLIEENLKGDSVGHTTNYLKVKVLSNIMKIGQIYSLKIIDFKDGVLIGEERN